MSDRSRMIAFAACCVAGWVSLILLFPRLDASAVRWGTRATRSEVIEAARQLTKRYNVDTSGWKFYVTAQANRDRALAMLERPESRILPKFTNLEYTVVASQPGTPANVRVVLSSELRPISFRALALRRGLGQKKGDGGRPPNRPRPEEGLFRQGRRSEGPVNPVDLGSQLELYAGADAQHYRQTAFSIPTPDGLLSAWEWGEGEQPGILARLQVYVRRGGIVRVEHELQISETVIARRMAQYELQQSLANPGRSLFIFFTISVACWYFFRSMATSFVPLRFALANLPIAAIPVLVDLVIGPDHDRIVILALRNNNTVMAQFSTSALFAALGLGAVVVLLTAGRSSLPFVERPRWASAQRLYLRRLMAKPMGSNMLAGLAAGPAIAAVPFLVLAASGRTDLVVHSPRMPMFITAAHPWAASLGESGPWLSIAAFALMRPWTMRLTRSRAVRGAILAVYGTAAVLLFIDPLPGSRVLAIAASGLLFSALWLTYRQLGLLAVWLASFSGTAAAMTLAFLQDGLRAEALSAATPAIVLATAGIYIRLFGREEDREEILKSLEILPRERIINERARLDAEFSVAAAAQQRLLPAAAPVVPGFTLAGSCTPAREVGGDLFDYMALPGGQVGLCVADVSGKGVPAALYMTLTKGMLASAQPKHLPLPVLVSRLNRHLLSTGQRKTFVTMSVAVVEPAARRFRHVRAGHNPPLLYRASTGTWELLKPRGIGLGLASTATFERILHEQQVELEGGDIAVFYSDGLTEMMDSDNELFGEERLAETVVNNADQGAQAIHDAVLAAAREFQGDAEQHDDLTLVVLKAELSLT